MKTTIFKKPPLVRALATAALCSGLMALSCRAQDPVGPPPQPAATESAAAAEPVVEATATPDALPASILPDSPLSQVIKLAQAGVDEVIIQTYITNSSSTFNLDSDKIIYLKDAGIPNDLIKAMIQRDTVLHAQIAAATPPPVIPQAPAAPATPPETAPDISTAPPTTEVTVDYFYNNLSPYGNWVMVDGYGRCWQPGVAVYNHDWQPYGDHGHWVYTDAGWYWVSDYSWGWAPFHYGRWFHHSRFGWCWYPDTVWGPSWVTWRYDNDYCGWAPLPPHAYYREGVGLVYNGATVDVGFSFGLDVSAFIFVGLHDFCDPHPYRHRLDHDRAFEMYHRTQEFNHFDRDDRHGFINHGIDPGRISRVTHTEIRPITIHDTSARVGRLGHGEEVTHGAINVNRPEFRDSHGNHVVDRPRPAEPAHTLPARDNQPHSVTVIGDHNNHPTPAQNPGQNRNPQPNNNFNRNNGNNGYEGRNQNNGNYQPHYNTPEPAQVPRPAANPSFAAPAQANHVNQFNRPAAVQRPAGPPEVNHAMPSAPVQHPQVSQPRQEPIQQPPHVMTPAPTPRPAEQPRVEQPQQHFAPPPAAQPAHNSQPAGPAPSHSNNDDKKGPH